VLAGEHALENVGVVAGERIEGANSPAGGGSLAGGDIAELLDGRRGIVDNGQGVQADVRRIWTPIKGAVSGGCPQVPTGLQAGADQP